MTLRIAVIGAGIMGADHARIVADELPGASLHVVCDMDEDRARGVADRLGAADVATDPEETVTRGDVDAVIVASPDFTHAPLSLACIAQRKPVLCEKPLSQKSAECIDVMNAESAAGRRFVQVGFMRRFDQSYVEMKQALDSGALGKALMMHNFHRNVETPNDSFTADMAITNSAPHEFDVARHVLGTDYAAVSAFKPKEVDGRPAPVFLVLETVDGPLVNVEVNNNATYGYDVRAEVVGAAGGIAMNHVAHTRLDASFSQSTRYDTDWRGRYAEAYRRQNLAFVRFAQTGQFPQIAADAWDGYATAVVAEAGVRALKEGGKVRVDMIDRPALYCT